MRASARQRLQDLEVRFTELEEKLSDTPEKEAISILHAMLQESLRASSSAPLSRDGHQATQATPEAQITVEDIANLHEEAPPMEGEAEQAGLPVDIEAPDFSLPDSNGNLVQLSDYRGKNVVLVFYPLDWSPGCSDQLSLYQSEIEEFENLNAQLIAISVDSLYSHGAWAAVRDLTFPLLADFHPKGQVARSYEIMRDSDGFSERALYVIDATGMIRYKEISPKLNHIPDIYKLFDQLRELESSTAGAAKK